MKVTFEPPHEDLGFEDSPDAGWDRIDAIAEQLGGEAAYFPEDGIGRILIDSHRVIATFWLN